MMSSGWRGDRQESRVRSPSDKSACPLVLVAAEECYSRCTGSCETTERDADGEGQPGGRTTQG